MSRRSSTVMCENIPADWSRSRIGDEVVFTRKGHIVRDAAQEIPFMPMESLPADGLYADKWSLRKRDEVRSGVFVREGDILIAKITPCLENGKLGIVRGTPRGWGYASTEVFPFATRR